MTRPALITRWATQAGRAPPAFASERARLDPRSLPELLADIARLAAEIPFHNDTGTIEGDWRRILLADQSFVLALLATADIDARAQTLTAWIEEARDGGSPRRNARRLTGLVEALFRFADDLDDWLGPAAPSDATRGQSIRRLAEDAIGGVLRPRLRRLLDEVAAEAAELRARFRRDRHHWDHSRGSWRRVVIEGEARGIAQAVERVWVGRTLEALADAAERFVEEMRERAARAASAFDATLRSGDHSPHPALVIVFAQLLGNARELLNAVPQKLIDCYQRTLLRAAPAQSRPDRMLAAVVPKAGTRPTLAKGTLLPAGKDADGRGIAFATDMPLQTTGAVLCEARLWRPEAGAIKLHRVTAGPDGQLGDPALGIAAPLPGEPFEASAIFSTPLLDLAGGTRRIALELDLGNTADAPGADLRVCVSTAQGWLPVPSPDWSLKSGTLAMRFVLPPDFPPLAPCPSETSGAVPQPALRLTLAAGSLAAARIADVRLNIAVKDLPDLVVRTPAGPASATAAAPFGAPPWAGGWLRIEHPMLAGSPLDRLVLHFDWASLPPGEGGFAEYYRGYVVDGQGQLFDFPPFDNAAFAVTLAAPVRGWESARRLPLFAPASLDIAPPVSAAPPPDIFAEAFEPAPPLMPERGPLAPDSWLAAGATDAEAVLPDHVRVTLAVPDHGFGHSLYPANVQYATEAIARGSAPLPARPGILRRAANAIIGLPLKLYRNIAAIEPQPEATEPAIVLLPNQPFQPLLSGIRLDYARTVNAGALTLHHAATLDGPVAMPILGAALFPARPDTLTLDLCFDGALAGDVLALLVQIGMRDAAAPNLDHRYRTSDGWASLPPGALIDDDTSGLTATGILRIAIPADAARPFALRLAFADATTPPAIVAIMPDAVSATRLMRGTETVLPPVPAGTVTGLPGVARVLQPLDTAGGQPPEPAAILRARTAERVRHRDRALAAWDIERLVLSEFPEVAQVRVFGEGNPSRQARAAGVTVVVVPAEGAAARISPQLRAGIAERLTRLSSPFARIAVVDPAHVPIDVAARLILTDADPAPIEAALTAFLSPWAERGLDLMDDAGPDRIRARIAEFLLRQPQVRAIDRLTVTLGDAAPGWHVPAPGEIAVTGISALASAS